MNNNLLTQMIYRIVLCCVSALAVLLSFNVFYAGQGANDLTWEFLKYYTNISNYFVFAVSVIVLADNVKRVRSGEKYGYNKKIKNLKFMTTVMILVTFLVYGHPSRGSYIGRLLAQHRQLKLPCFCTRAFYT
ncbi:MAG: hypothetical protein LUF82_02015 [Clostridia bacterium]|nr:hypothetical protein [Clostridia bacterium]